MKKLLQEYREFILTGNVFMLAVAFIMGEAIKAVVDSFLHNIIQPIIGAIVGKPTFDSVLKLGKGRLTYGAFITDVLNLVVIGLVVFLMVKAYQNFEREKAPEEPPADIQLLTEIRDSLRSRA
jgi:large conductance mechanosensitive channel